MEHPIHIHGHQFLVTATDGNDIPANVRSPGIWPFHCHIPHHMANNMREETGGM